MSTGYIYFIHQDESPYVKIGFSNDPEARLKQLQTANPNKLWLAYAYEGSEKDEAALHEKYDEYRINGEWFKCTDDLFDDLSEMYDIRSFVTDDIFDCSSPSHHLFDLYLKRLYSFNPKISPHQIRPRYIDRHKDEFVQYIEYMANEMIITPEGCSPDKCGWTRNNWSRD